MVNFQYLRIFENKNHTAYFQRSVLERKIKMFNRKYNSRSKDGRFAINENILN